MNTMEHNLKNLYICPTVRAVQINGSEIICTSPGSRTEGYGINQYGLNEDDWE